MPLGNYLIWWRCYGIIVAIRQLIDYVSVAVLENKTISAVSQSISNASITDEDNTGISFIKLRVIFIEILRSSNYYKLISWNIQ